MRLFLLTIIALMLYSCSPGSFEDEHYKVIQAENAVTIQTDSLSVKLTIIRNDIVKVSYFPVHINPEEESGIVILKDDKPAPFRIKQNRNLFSIMTDRIIVELSKEPFELNFYNRKGKPLLLSSGEFISRGESKTAFFRIQEGDHFYGMGQKSIPVDRKGYAFDSYNRHIGGYTKPYANMQLNIPYVYSPVGWGLLFDNTFPGHYDLGKTKRAEWNYTATGGTFTYYFVQGEDAPQLLKKYFDLTGYFPMFPKWTLGLLQSKCAYENDQQVYTVLDSFQMFDLPVDVIILDAYWFGGYKPGYPHNMGNFSWLKSNFPDHQEYLNRLKSMGIKTILINEPYINLDSENYSLLKERGWLVKKPGMEGPWIFSPFWAGDASLMDITHPEAREWLWGKLRDIISEGVDGLWIDLTEPEHPVPEGDYYAGKEAEIHNIYSWLWAETIWEGFRKDFPEKRVFNLTRSGFAGIQRFGAMTWSGDASKTWNALKLQVPMLIGTSISGMPHFSSDIGGFTNTHDVTDGSTVFTNRVMDKVLTTPEMYTRWFQFGVFSPFLRPHSGEEQFCEPFAFDENTLIITSSFLKLRYRLIPYLYSYMYRTSVFGEPLIKPLFFLFEDPQVPQYQDFEYMFGNEMLVAPVVEEGQVRKTVYLPKLDKNFRWIDYWTDEPFESGLEYSLNMSIHQIPVFVRQPAIIPMAKLKKYVDETPDDTLTLEIYPGGHAEFMLYEDDGLTFDYEKNEYAITLLETDLNRNDVIIRIPAAEGNYPEMVSERTWLLMIHLVRGFNEILINGEKALPAAGFAELERNSYVFDQNRFNLVLNVGGLVNEDIEVRIKKCSINK